MNGKVIFLNTWLNCPEERKREHQRIQELIWEKKMEFEYSIRDYNQYQKTLSRQRSHNLWRSRMRLVENENKDISASSNDADGSKE